VCIIVVIRRYTRVQNRCNKECTRVRSIAVIREAVDAVQWTVTQLDDAGLIAVIMTAPYSCDVRVPRLFGRCCCVWNG
jgi:hypothetical protein